MNESANPLQLQLLEFLHSAQSRFAQHLRKNML